MGIHHHSLNYKMNSLSHVNEQVKLSRYKEFLIWLQAYLMLQIHNMNHISSNSLLFLLFDQSNYSGKSFTYELLNNLLSYSFLYEFLNPLISFISCIVFPSNSELVAAFHVKPGILFNLSTKSLYYLKF